MTDPTQTPIIVDQSPVPAQFMAAFRQAMAALSIVASALGFTKVADLAIDDKLLGAIGVLSWGAFVIWGQLATRINAKRLAIAAKAAPNDIAQIK